MSPLYFLGVRRGFRPLALLAGLLLAAQTVLAASVPIYSTKGATAILECRVFCGSVSDPNNAADNDFQTAATINVPFALKLGGTVIGPTVKLRMNMEKEAPKNFRAGVVVRRNGGLLNLLNIDLASEFRLRTFLGSQEQESVVVSSTLVQAILLNENEAVRFEFIASKPFDKIELEASSIVSLGYRLDVLYAYAIDANVLNTTEGLVTRFDTPTTKNYDTTNKGDDVLSVCVNSNVSEPLNAVDNILTNYATFNTVAGVSCPNTLQIQLEGPAPAGYVAGFVLGSGSLLDVSVLENLRVTTYQGSVKQEQASGSNLLQLELLPNNQSVVRFTTIKPFDRVELKRTSAVDLLNNLRIYYGFGVTPSTFRDQEPKLSFFADPANNFQELDPLGLISNPELAADNNLTGNYATVSSLVEVLTAPRLKLRLNATGKAGNLAGVRLGLGTGITDINVLSNARIRTYSGENGNTLVETYKSNRLLNVELLAGGQFEVAFLTTQDFDWVEIELATGVALLNDARIYFAFAEDRPIGFPTVIVPPRPLPVQLTAFGARARGMAVDVSWATATEVNSHYFQVERSVEAGRGFVAVGRREAAGNSSSGQQYTFTDAAAAQLPAGTLYYRLRQVDLDGTETYSTVAVVTRRAAIGPLVLYPNPAAMGSQLRINLPTGAEGSHQLLLYSMQGALVSRQPLSGSVAGAEVTLPRLSPGIYQAVVQDAAGQPVGRQRLVLTEGR